MFALTLVAKNLVPHTNKNYEEINIKLLELIFVFQNLKMNYPPEIEHIDQEMSDDTAYLSDPEHGYSHT